MIYTVAAVILGFVVIYYKQKQSKENFPRFPFLRRRDQNYEFIKKQNGQARVGIFYAKN